MSTLPFNPNIKLVLADVDETIADVYTDATPATIHELNTFVAEGRVLFLVSGGGLQSIRERIVDKLEPEVRHKILIAHCSGAEVWGFEKGGEIKNKPYYGLYEGHFTDEQKEKWREVVNTLIDRFHLKTYPAQPKKNFIAESKGDPLSVMLADRGPQITFEFVNSINLTTDQKRQIEKELNITIPLNHDTYDLRYPILEEGTKLYAKAQLPIIMRFGGTMALDNIIQGVDKTRAVKYVLEDKQALQDVGLSRENIKDEHEIEIWGDKFSQKKNGPDFQMCLAVSPKVRAIDFRDEDPADIPDGYNVQIWNGEKRLHEGLLEYLKSR